MFGETKSPWASIALENATKLLGNALPQNLQAELKQLAHNLKTASPAEGAKQLRQFINDLEKLPATTLTPEILTRQGAFNLEHQMAGRTAPLNPQEKVQLENFLKNEVYPLYSKLSQDARHALYALAGESDPQKIAPTLEKIVQSLKPPSENSAQTAGKLLHRVNIHRIV